jgi:hypothetical protein
VACGCCSGSLFWFAADSIRTPFDQQHAARPALPPEAPADGGFGTLSIPRPRTDMAP